LANAEEVKTEKHRSKEGGVQRKGATKKEICPHRLKGAAPSGSRRLQPVGGFQIAAFNGYCSSNSSSSSESVPFNIENHIYSISSFEFLWVFDPTDDSTDENPKPDHFKRNCLSAGGLQTWF
jgi:hypothetical protein